MDARLFSIAILIVSVVAHMTGRASADPIDEAEAAYRDGRYGTAFELYKPLAEHGSIPALIRLARLYSGMEGVKPDATRALSINQPLADQGVAPGMTGLGVAYYTGFGVPKDIKKALHWFSLAAAEDKSAAMFLGAMYMNGEGVPVDVVQGINWISTAAEAGETTAQYLLGTCYEHGNGVPMDKIQAVKWYLIAHMNVVGWEERVDADLAQQRAWILSLQMTPNDRAKAANLAAVWKPGSAHNTY